MRTCSGCKKRFKTRHDKSKRRIGWLHKWKGALLCYSCLKIAVVRTGLR